MGVWQAWLERVKQNKIQWLLLALLWAGLTLRLIAWQEKSLWQDELFTLALATGNNLFEATIRPDDWLHIPGVLAVANPDNGLPHLPSAFWLRVSTLQSWPVFWEALTRNVQAPLYPVLMRLWAMFVDPDPVGLRQFSIAVGALTIPAAFLLGRELAGKSLGLMLAALVAFSGFHVMWSQTARVYTLTSLLAILATWSLVRLIRQARRECPDVSDRPWLVWLVFISCTLLGLYSHYLYLFVALFHGVTALWFGVGFTRPLNRRFLWPFLLATVLVVLGFSPWLPVMHTQSEFQAMLGHGTLSGLWAPLNMLENLWKGLTELMGPKDMVLKIVVSGVWLLGGWCLWRRSDRADLRMAWAVAGLWLLFSIGGQMGLDLLNDTHRLTARRYLNLMAPAVYLLTAASILALPARVKKTAIVLLLALMLWNSWGVVTGEKFMKKEDYRSAAQWIVERWQPGDIVLVSHAGIHAVGMAYYLPNTIEMVGLDRGNAGTEWSSAELDPVLRQATRHRKRAFVVLTHAPGPLKKSLLGWFTRCCQQPLAQEKFSGIRLEIFELFPHRMKS